MRRVLIGIAAIVGALLVVLLAYAAYVLSLIHIFLKAALSQPADPSVKEAPRAHRYIRKQKRPPAAGV